MLVLRAEKEYDVYRIVLEAIRNSPSPANAVYVGKARPRGVIVHGIREDILPEIPGYLVYRVGRIEYPGVIVGIVTRGSSREEAIEDLRLAIESYKSAVIKEEL